MRKTGQFFPKSGHLFKYFSTTGKVKLNFVLYFQEKRDIDRD